jgi:Raf kinase inhibitor-like YbhB/YbcL family protein
MGESPPKEGEMVLSVSSSVFGEGDMIPARYTCQGEDISPPLAWSEVPTGTQSLALIMDDPDAPVGVFTHWVMFNISAVGPGLSEAVPAEAQLPDGALQGRNDFGRVGYGGPCPPPGRPHRYQFTVYSLDSLLDLRAGATKGQVLDAVEGHILAQGRLTGRYQR